MPLVRAIAAAACIATIAGCVSVPRQPEALAAAPDGRIVSQSLACGSAPRAVAVESGGAKPSQALDGRALRVLTWNLHKNGDPGWQRDLARFADDRDLLMIQEAALDDELRAVVEGHGYAWLLGTAFGMHGRIMGVMTAARVRPSASCAQRSVEPLLQIPKAAVITVYPLAGSTKTLAVANVHAINFTLLTGGYRAQLDAVADELARHEGPIVLAGDFNTWSEERRAVVAAVAQRLGLSPVVPGEDHRTRFLGQQVDYLFVRGLDVIEARTPSVRSSDHNPVLATLRVRDGAN